MGFFKTEAETAWTSKLEEVEYEIDASVALARDALHELERLKSACRHLHGVTNLYRGADHDVLHVLAEHLDRAVMSYTGRLVDSLQTAMSEATHLAQTINSFG